MAEDAPDALKLVIFAILANADHAMSPEEVAEEIARLALMALGIGVRGERERGH